MTNQEKINQKAIKLFNDHLLLVRSTGLLNSLPEEEEYFFAKQHALISISNCYNLLIDIWGCISEAGIPYANQLEEELNQIKQIIEKI